jgi:TetR/AcrR family transcriptional regulator
VTRAKTPRKARTYSPDDSEGRQRILHVALRAFAGLGYEGTTTAAVAREAGVTQPLVHHHFGSKEGLWRAAMDQLFSEVRLFTELDPNLPPTRALLQVVEGFVRLSAARPELTRIIAREGASKGPRLKYLLDRYLRPQLQEVVATLRAEQRAGNIDPGIQAELLFFFVTGAGAHLFDVAGLAREGLGVDVTSAQTRENFVALVLSVLERGVVRNQGATTR